jgi:hypothetical protein
MWVPICFVSLAVVLLADLMAIAIAQDPQTPDAQDETLVLAGETFTFTITLPDSSIPTTSDGTILFRVTPHGMVVPKYSCGLTVPGRREYVCSVRTSPDERGTIQRQIRDLRIQYPDRIEQIQTPPIIFRVIGKPPRTIVEVEAEITINLSQAQLLRRAAHRLQERFGRLKTRLSEAERNNWSFREVSELMHFHVKEELTALSTTQNEFDSLATEKEQMEQSRVFFGDLRINYEQGLASISERGARSEDKLPFTLISYVVSVSEARLPYHETLRAFEANLLAYDSVARTGKMNFDLDVKSTPAEADISYFRRGDTPRKHHESTNSTIHSLTYAIWTIRLEKEGYHVVEREYDPYREPHRVVHVELRKQ